MVGWWYLRTSVQQDYLSHPGKFSAVLICIQVTGLVPMYFVTIENVCHGEWKNKIPSGYDWWKNGLLNSEFICVILAPRLCYGVRNLRTF
jgi:hypothetical protein